MSAHRLVEFYFFRLEGDGISRKQAAARLGMTEHTLSNFVTGYREPKIDLLEKMLKSVGYRLCAVQEPTKENTDV